MDMYLNDWNYEDLEELRERRQAKEIENEEYYNNLMNEEDIF